jgi:hypothetical protein
LLSRTRRATRFPIKTAVVHHLAPDSGHFHADFDPASQALSVEGRRTPAKPTDFDANRRAVAI